MGYLGLIRREDFDSLLKFGEIVVYNYVQYDFEDCLLQEHTELLDSLMDNCSQMSYSFEFVLLRFSRFARKKYVSIKDCEELYALDEDAYDKISLSVDRQVRFSKPIWIDCFRNILCKRAGYNSLKGVENLWGIIQLKSKPSKRRLFRDVVLPEYSRIKVNHLECTGYLSIWTYLLCYDRHENYPRDMNGYFMDMVHVLVNFLKREYVLSIENTEFYKLVSKDENKDADYKKLCRLLKQKLPSLINKIPEEGKGDFYKVAPIFLRLKDIMQSNGIRNGNVYEGKTLEAFLEGEMEIDQQAFLKAYYLLGLFLGGINTIDKRTKTGNGLFKKTD